MPLCTNIIANEGLRNGWLMSMTNDDMTRILARYKEHVNYWNVPIDTIRQELQAFARAIDQNHNYFDVALIFDRLQPKRFPPA